jgi:hypothetical protein
MRYFSIDELTTSTEARKMCIDNTPTSEVVANLTALVEAVLDPLRDKYGHPIMVSSGYRCPRLNKAVGGAVNSQHTTGEAADIYVGRPKEMAELFSLIYYTLPYDQLIWERGNDEAPAWIHVSYRRGGDMANRYQCLRYDGKKYYPYKPTLR